MREMKNVLTAFQLITILLSSLTLFSLIKVKFVMIMSQDTKFHGILFKLLKTLKTFLKIKYSEDTYLKPKMIWLTCPVETRHMAKLYPNVAGWVTESKRVLKWATFLHSHKFSFKMSCIVWSWKAKLENKWRLRLLNIEHTAWWMKRDQ